MRGIHLPRGDSLTIVVAVVTPENLVLASDSATTQELPTTNGPRTASIWNSANKIINLRKAWPLGLMTFGRAAFKGQSIATHCKDLRRLLSGTAATTDEAYPTLDPGGFTVEHAVLAVHGYFRELYDDEPGGSVGFLIGGFGASDASPELWQVLITDGPEGDTVERLCPPGESGIYHQGMTDAITRLVDGASLNLGPALVTMGVPQEDSEQAAHNLRASMQFPWAWSGMPVGETIDLARFLVDTTINFVRFMPGDASVGGPIEIAALTRHEGFKWVQRKHFFRAELNPMPEVN
jgi:hypothetical protein